MARTRAGWTWGPPASDGEDAGGLESGLTALDVGNPPLQVARRYGMFVGAEVQHTNRSALDPRLPRQRLRPAPAPTNVRQAPQASETVKGTNSMPAAGRVIRRVTLDVPGGGV